MDALERFRKEFKGWVRSHNQIKEFNTDPDEILGRLENKIPESNLRQIGAAFINGWLENEPEEDRRYFVRESDRPGLRGGQWMLEHAGSGNVNPCWELYVQMADYSRIRTVAEKHGMTTRLEDGLLDITVYAGNKMVLYVENKKEKSQALHLLDRMHKYGESGFSMDDPDKGNDPLRKSKYLIRGDAFPEYLAVRRACVKRQPVRRQPAKAPLGTGKAGPDPGRTISRASLRPPRPSVIWSSRWRRTIGVYPGV